MAQSIILVSFLITTLFAGACAQVGKQSNLSESQVEAKMNEALRGSHRSNENKKRDEHRHPMQTLKFFEISPHHSILEVSPGGGWYTEILAPFVNGTGQLTLAIFSDSSDKKYRIELNQKLKNAIKDSPHIYGSVEYVTFEPPIISPLGKSNQYDRIVTFRNIHSWLPERQVEEIFKEFFRVLKPGGVLGIVQHRLPEDAKPDEEKTKGYIKESFVIGLAEKAGFALAAKSEINSNSKDKASHPKGVWTLPPSMAMGEKDRKKYEEIGESDRMTLRFIKPE